MQKTPTSLRLQIALFGRTNVGKSSLLNMISGQQVSITSHIPGTTTDVVQKSMELLPIGPVVFLDTAGLDDVSKLAGKRTERTDRIFSRCDAAVLVTDSYHWGEYEKLVARKTSDLGKPLLVVLNKIDMLPDDSINRLQAASGLSKIMGLSAVSTEHADEYITVFKHELSQAVPSHLLSHPPILGDLVGPNAHVIFIVPIDIEAPKGRLILPQVQSIRDILDHDGAVTVVKEHQYTKVLENLKNPPDLVVCDSQVVDKMVEQTPESIPCTTFSTLFARVKGDLEELVQGAKIIDTLMPDDTILIAEACSHHPGEDDIGMKKIPRWIEEHLGYRPNIIHSKGRDYPDTVEDMKLVIHCGACMLTRGEMLSRIDTAKAAGVQITNYGVCISHLKGVLERIITPFSYSDNVYRRSKT